MSAARKAPMLRADALGDDEARVDLVTVADGRAPCALVAICQFVPAEDGDGLAAEPPGADEFDLVQAERNARRLVAAWNFTRAVPLERLEEWCAVGKVLGDTGETGEA